jgi:tripartite-type tricarboxylate transporter receptor subunit TctC
MIASPATPPDQIKILRDAYAKGLNDPDLIAEAKKKGLDPELIHGNDIQNLAKEVMIQPAEVITLMKKVMGE